MGTLMYVGTPVLPSKGRRMACVLVSNEILAAILRGELDRCISSAPSDLSVVSAQFYDGHTTAIYIESAIFEPLDDRGAVPVVNVTFMRTGGTQ